MKEAGFFSVYGSTALPSFLIPPEHQVCPDQDGQEAQIRPGEDEEVGARKVESHREIRLEGNETRHGRDEGTEASDIDA